MVQAAAKLARAAFEVSKGERQVVTLSEADVERYLDLSALLDGLKAGCRGLELGEVQSPPRPAINVPGKNASTLGAVALGRAPGRLTDTEITVYTAMGVAMEDMVAANLAYRSALAKGAGGRMVW